MKPNYTITETILNLVQLITEWTTKLSIEKRELHLRKENRIRSIHSSLAIEKNSLTLEQVTDIIEGRRVLGPPKDIHEVQNAYEAYDRVFTFNPYDIDNFLQAHALLTMDLVRHPGQFRPGDVGVYDADGTVVHVGARPQFVPILVKELFAWAETSIVSAIVKSCIVHFELEIIHPFEDGNGRMGRLWQSLILSRWNPIFEWLPIESVIYNHQQGYYDALTMSNHANDATIFIEFMLEAILETLKGYQTSNHFDKLDILNSREKEVYLTIEQHLQVHHKITTTEAQELIGFSLATSRRYLVKFTELGLLKMDGTTRGRIYRLNEEES